MRRYRFASCLLPLMLAACASTTVKKDPGPHDRGIRYYRPKPYLFLQPAKGESTELVSMTLQYLPDFTEEYSLHIRAGIGTNTTNFKLDNGWNLTELNTTVDSRIPENIAAFASLLETTGKVFAPTAGGRFAPTAGTTAVVIRATNVPLGYYESVISPGPDGKKRLYGWRYVGFAPYAQCPRDGSGVECVDCHQDVLYGLVFENGVMVFKPLHAATVPDFTTVVVARPAPSNPQVVLAERVVTAVRAVLKMPDLPVADVTLGAISAEKIVSVEVLLPPDRYTTVTADEAKFATTSAALNTAATAAVQAVFGGDISYSAQVVVRKKG